MLFLFIWVCTRKMGDDAIHLPKFQFTPHALIERLIREIIIEVIKEQTSQTWLVSMVIFMEGILFCRYSSRSRFLMSVVGIRSLSTSKKSTGWPLFTKYNSTMFFLICNRNICMAMNVGGIHCNHSKGTWFSEKQL